MLKMKILRSVLFLLLIYVVFGKKCENEDLNLHLGTKTPYRTIGNQNFSKIEYDGCVPQKIWMISRHGTRNPSAEFIEKLSSRLPKIRDLIVKGNSVPNEILLNSQIEAFKKWKSDLLPEEEKKLTKEGKRELLELGERMQGRFPDLLPPVYSNTSYKFKYTHTQRTKKSAKAFAVGLFGKKTAKDVWYPEAMKKDPILRFYKLCKKWSNDVKNNPKSLEEQTKFSQESYVQEIVRNFNKRLQLNNELNFADLHLMYTTCAFETAWNKVRKSPWCQIFDHETIKVMEYAEDLKYYWIDGYGYELTYKQACPAFNDMLEFLESSKEKYPKASIYFTHSGTLLKIISHLGLYYDNKPLLHSQYPENEDRNYRVSKIDTFATNLAFVLFKCGNINKLLVLHQEKIVRLPSCPDNDLCDLDIVKDFYSDSVNHCDFKKMCDL